MRRRRGSWLLPFAHSMDKKEPYKYPKGEVVWIGHHNAAGDLMFIVTSKPLRDYYYLYQLVDGAFKKLGRGKDPGELERKFKVDEQTRG